MKLRLVLFVVAGLFVGADKPKEAELEIRASNDRVIVEGEGFKLEGNCIKYDQSKGSLICEGQQATLWQKRNDKLEVITNSKIIDKTLLYQRPYVEAALRAYQSIEITTEGGSVVVESGDYRFQVDRLRYEPRQVGKREFEFRAEGYRRTVIQFDGLRIQAETMRYNPVSGILSCKGDTLLVPGR